MPRRKYSFIHKTDAMSEEIVAALLSKRSCDFHELFPVIYQSLRERKAAGGGEEALRFRVYEKLQNFVVQGLVKKTEKQYTGVESALLARSSQFAEAREEAKKRRAINESMLAPVPDPAQQPLQDVGGVN
jgi:hypothetical protein